MTSKYLRERKRSSLTLGNILESKYICCQFFFSLRLHLNLLEAIEGCCGIFDCFVNSFSLTWINFYAFDYFSFTLAATYL